MQGLWGTAMGGMRYWISLPLFAVGLFLFGVASGALAYSQIEEMVPQIVEGVFRGIVVPESRFETALNIVTRNATATLVLIVTGLTVIAPFLSCTSTAFLRELE